MSIEKIRLKKIPVYTIHTISCKTTKVGLLEILSFEEHLKNAEHIVFPHRHDFYYLLYITSGKGTHTIDFKTYPVRNNQLFFMSPGQVHEWNLPLNTKGYTLFFNKELFNSKDFKIENEWSFFHNFFDDAAFVVPKSEQKSLESLFSGILKEYNTNQHNQDKVTKSLTMALLYKIDELLKQRKNISQENNNDIIRRFDLLIDKNFTEEHHLDFYANKLNITPNYLNALCKKILGKSAKELLSERQLLEAKRLIKHSNLSMNEIADYLNFNSPSYFNRFFSKHEKQTPFRFKSNS